MRREVIACFGCMQVRKREVDPEEGVWAYEIHAQLPGVSLEGVKCACTGCWTAPQELHLSLEKPLPCLSRRGRCLTAWKGEDWRGPCLSTRGRCQRP